MGETEVATGVATPEGIATLTAAAALNASFKDASTYIAFTNLSNDVSAGNYGRALNDALSLIGHSGLAFATDQVALGIDLMNIADDLLVLNMASAQQKQVPATFTTNLLYTIAQNGNSNMPTFRITYNENAPGGPPGRG